MKYSKTISIPGNSEKASDFLLKTFTNEGFRIVSKSRHALEFTGPGMSSTRQNPLRGASDVKITIDFSSITLDAELGGVEKMKKFLIYFISGMALFFVLLFGILHFVHESFKSMEPVTLFFIVTSPFYVWIILIPLMTKSIKHRAENALDTLIG